MGVVKLSTAGILDYSKTSNFLSGNAPVSFGAFDLLETTTLTTTTAETVFTGLGSYSDYKHLQLRAVYRRDAFGYVGANLYMRLNADSANNYSRHELKGIEGTVYSSAQAPTSVAGYIQGPASEVATGAFGVAVIDILDAFSTSKNKTVRIFSGVAGQDAANSVISLSSGAWFSTSAITSLTLGAGTGNLAGTRFSLYGVK